MKKIYTILVLLLLTACNSNVLKVEDLSRFHKVYVEQARKPPYLKTLEITDSIQTISIRCGLGGVLPARKDLSISFRLFYDSVEAYNMRNSTDYDSVPTGSFKLSSENVTIKKGKFFSSSIDVDFKTKGYIEGGKSYLLPIGINAVGDDVPINEQFRIVYLVITGKYPLGKEPPIKVFDLSGKSLTSVFPYQNSLIVVQSNGIFQVHNWDDKNKVYMPAAIITNLGWNIFDKVIGDSDRLFARWSGTGVLWEYSLNVSDLSFTGDYVTHGENFNDFDMISYSKQLDGLLCRKPSGELYLIRRSEAMWDKSTLIGKDFEKYKMITAYENGFLCVDGQGEMFFYPIEDDLSLGEVKHVGSGWDKYNSIISREKQLQALDSQGILWQYNFDLAGFWDIK